MTALLFVLIGALLIFAPFYLGLAWTQTLVSSITGVVVMFFSALALAIKRFYLKPSANLAYVRTGWGGTHVLIDGGSLVFPVVHKVVPVSLETMKLEVERKGPDALITRDNLRVDVKAEFYIKVRAIKEDVLNAARSLGEKSVDAHSVSALVFEKLVSALRSVAATKDLVEIHAQRDAFASSVHNLVVTDLQQNGLTLESVTISRLDQTSQELLSDNNIFDAQGKKKITEITQAALVERNRIERDAQREMTLKNVQTRKEVLDLERQQAEAEAEQSTQVAKIRAEKQRESQTYQIEQERQVKEAEIQRDLAVQTTAIERDKALVLKEQELKQTDIERAKAIEVAEREKQIAVATKEKQRAQAEQEVLEAQAERERANQDIITVQVTAQADREAETKLIAAKQQIEQDRLKRQVEAEVQAYAEVKRAEAQQKAAELEAQAILRKADAEARAKELVAQGEQALKMVDVNIAREQVEVQGAQVEVERQALENKQTFSDAALRFELTKLQIEAGRDIQKAIAEAIGRFMSNGQFTIFGDPGMMANMVQQYFRGMGVGAFVDGLMKGSPLGGDGSVVPQLANQVLSLVQTLTGKVASPEVVQQVNTLVEQVVSSVQKEAPSQPEQSAGQPSSSAE